VTTSIAQQQETSSRLEQRRRASGLSQVKLGQLAGCSYQTIHHVERGNYLPRLTTALALARALNTTVDDLFEVDSV
jgi:putative transcriptional regulator